MGQLVIPNGSKVYNDRGFRNLAELPVVILSEVLTS